VRLNVEALVALTRLYLPAMLGGRRGGILNVSSTAGFQPLPHYALYAASKAFVTSFTQALWAELDGTGVRVLAFCPGPVTNTRFREHAGGRSPFAESRSQPREAAVAAAIRSFERGDPLVVPGAINSLLARLVGLTPLRPRLLVTNWAFRRTFAREARARRAGDDGRPSTGAEAGTAEAGEASGATEAGKESGATGRGVPS
jgi:short-subunit dehydrogenase